MGAMDIEIEPGSVFNFCNVNRNRQQQSSLLCESGKEIKEIFNRLEDGSMVQGG
jgi:hypothetical protein